MIEGVVGFAVIADEKTGVLKPTCLFPRLMIERLSKEAVAVADGPLRLLETMNFSFLFRKIVTREYFMPIFSDFFSIVLNKLLLRSFLDHKKHEIICCLLILVSFS